MGHSRSGGWLWPSVVSVSLYARAFGNEKLPRIYVHPLPDCSFDHFTEAEIDGIVWPFHPARPPLLPIHRRLANGRYSTSDPANATMFYVPAPFFLWDSGWIITVRLSCGNTLYESSSTHAFQATGTAHPISDLEPILGNHSWTIMVWINASRVTTSPHDVFVIVAIGAPTRGEGFILGIRGGCPILSGGDTGNELTSECSTGIDDNSWHHVAATFDGRTATVYVDDEFVIAQPMKFDTSHGPAFLGGLGGTNISHYRTFQGEMRELRSYDTAIPAKLISQCRVTPPLDRGVHSYCFKLVRQTIEGSPWFQRKRGWDHFVLFAGFDYPAKFDPLHQPDEGDFILEKAWPAFANFSVLHFGSRVERCFAELADPHWSDVIGTKFPSCVRRYFRTITIPPFLEGERFDCKEMLKIADEPRNTRIGYRGMSYSATIERQAMHGAATTSDMIAWRKTRQIVLEFTNWTHELLQAGKCTLDLAFEGLCNWKKVGQPVHHSIGNTRSADMKKRALELWKSSELCLVLPGDGGYELRLYSMMNLGCVPVIVHIAGVSLPKLPFVHALPWHEFSIIWTIQSDTRSLHRAAHRVLYQLLCMNPLVIRRKREAVLQYAHHFSWDDQRGISSRCGGKHRRLDNSLDLVVDELLARSRMPVDPREIMQVEHYGLKVPYVSMHHASLEDLTGNGCPPGFPLCETHPDDPLHGETCRTPDGSRFKCPFGCTPLDRPPWCVQEQREDVDVDVPCRTSKCSVPIQLLQPIFDDSGNRFLRIPRLALISSSRHAALTKLTRPSLERFCAEHPGRYDLLVEDEALLDPQDWHPSWNKIALLRRALILDGGYGGYDAVIWIDDDILITNPSKDPIYEAIVDELLVFDKERLVLASKDVRDDARVALNTGILVFKKGRLTMKLIDTLFRIGRKRHLVDGQWQLPRNAGWFEQDAFGIYVKEHGTEAFELLEHRQIQSLVRQGQSFWQPGDFSAHFAVSNLDVHLQLIKQFSKQHGLHLFD